MRLGNLGTPRTWGAFALLALAPAMAHADTAVCVAAADRAQGALESKQLVEAGSAATLCASKECPDVIRNDCARWLKQVRREVATAVFRVVDRNGVEIPAARVTADGPWGKREVTTGEPVELDPGKYKLAYDSDTAHGDKSIVLGIGEKNDAVVLLAEPRIDGDAKARAAQAPVWPWPWIAGGVAVVGLATFGLLQISSSSKFSSLDETCGSKGTRVGCDQDQIDGVRTQVVASGVGLGVGLVAGAAAIVLFMLEPKPVKSPLSARPRFMPQRGGAAVLFAF